MTDGVGWSIAVLFMNLGKEKIFARERRTLEASGPREKPGNRFRLLRREREAKAGLVGENVAEQGEGELRALRADVDIRGPFRVLRDQRHRIPDGSDEGREQVRVVAAELGRRPGHQRGCRTAEQLVR